MRIIPFKFLPFFSKNLCIFLLVFNQANAISKTNNNLLSNEATRLFTLAEQALKKNDTSIYQHLLPQLKNYPLINYLERDALMSKLRTNPNSIETDEAISAFLQEHQTEVVARKLRYAWLIHLAKRNKKELFLQYYQPSSSLKLKCNKLEFQLAKNNQLVDIEEQVKVIWLTGESLPKSCDRMLSLWKNTGGLTDSLVWQRMLLAADNKQYQLVRYLNKLRSSKSKNSAQLLINISRRPKILVENNLSCL